MASNTAPAIRHPIPIRKTLGLPHLGITRPIKRAVNTTAIATVAKQQAEVKADTYSAESYQSGRNGEKDEEATHSSGVTQRVQPEVQALNGK